MPSWSEVLGNGAVGREEALRMPRGFEPLHVILALTRWPMGVLTVVAITALAMFLTRAEYPLRGPIALQFICDNNFFVGRTFTPLTNSERTSWLLVVPPTLYKDIEHIVLLIHRAPEVVPFAINSQKDLVQVPFVPRLRVTATQPIGVVLAKLPTPLADGFMGHRDTAFKQQFLHVAVAQGETIVTNMEVTFEEARAHLGMETQRQWNDRAIARTTPGVGEPSSRS